MPAEGSRIRRPTWGAQRPGVRYGSRLSIYIITLVLCIVVLCIHWTSHPPRFVVVAPDSPSAVSRTASARLGRRESMFGWRESHADTMDGDGGYHGNHGADAMHHGGHVENVGTTALAVEASTAEDNAAELRGTGLGSDAGPELAVLIPIWRNIELVEPLIANLSAHLLAQDVTRFTLHVVEQHPAQNFTPGLIMDAAYLGAKRVQGLGAEDLVAYVRPTLRPLPGVPFRLDSSDPAFMHLGAAQSAYGFQLPYDDYCGGAWVMRAGLFDRIRGWAQAYVGYEGLEDDMCHRLTRALQVERLPRVPPARGRFAVLDDVHVMVKLAALHREDNERAYRRRWAVPLESPRLIAEALAETESDGIDALPDDWQSRFFIKEERQHLVWWAFVNPQDTGESLA